MLIAMLLAPGARAGIFADVPFTHWAYQALHRIDLVVAPQSPRPLGCPQPSTRIELAFLTFHDGDLLAKLPARPASVSPAALDQAYNAWCRLADYFQPELQVLRAKMLPMAASVEASRRRLQAGLGEHLSGRVVDRAGQPLAAAMVQIDDWPACPVEADGRWRVDDLAPGEHVVTVCGADGAPLAVVATKAGAQVDCVLPSGDAPATAHHR